MERQSQSDQYYKTPFHTYEEICNAIKNRSYFFSFRRAPAFDMATRMKIANIYLFFLGFILSTIVTLIMSLLSNTYWTLIFIIILLFLNFIIDKIKFIFPISLVLLILSLCLNLSFWLTELAFALCLLFIGNYIGWAFITSFLTDELLNNQSLFEVMWEERSIAIRNKKGDFYIKYLKMSNNR